jgi:hypothetical protein
VASRALLALALAAWALPSAWPLPSVAEPGEIAGELVRLGLSASDAEHAGRGEVVARILPQPEDNAAVVVGAVFVDARPERLLEDIRSLDAVRSRRRVLQAGRFSEPPVSGDLDGLVFEPQDLADLRRCRVGDCDIRVNARTMAAARELDWSASGSAGTASLALKSALLAEVRAYREHGAAGMSIYHESDTPEQSGSELHALLRSTPPPFPESPSYMRYLQEYPSFELANVEGFFFWSKEALRKPVVSAVHLSLQTVIAGGDPRYLIALTHVYDSHYFLAYAEFLSVLPVPGAARGFFLVRSIRARIDPPHWFRGLLLRKIKREMRGTLKVDLERTRRRLEPLPRGDGAQ